MADHLVALDDRWSVWRRFAVRGAGLPVDFVTAFAVPVLAGAAAAPAGDAEPSEWADAARTTTARAMCAALTDETFMAALTWQNPAVVETWAGRAALAARAGTAPGGARRNERERVISRYAQRYATKNESIGFFGPVAWGTFGTDGPPLAWRGGLGLRRLSVSFEVWVIDHLARAWACLHRVRPHLPVRLHPAATVRDGHVLRPRRAPLPLDGVTAALVAALADGTPYEDVVVEAARSAGVESAAARAAAESLAAAGVLQLGFRIPFDEHPERHLRRQVERITEPTVRAELTGHLDRLDAARSEVAAVATDPVRLLQALSRITDGITDAGGAPRRAAARNGMGRTAVYLDCRRDLDAEIGPELFDDLRAPLGLLLRSADWLAAEVADVVDEHLATQFATLRRRHARVTLAELQAAATEILVPGSPAVAGVLADFQLRWAEVVPASGAGPVRRRCADVEAAVTALFPECPGGWAAARHHAPDLLVCREEPGRYRWVLGELHVALNTLENRLFVTQCDDRSELVAATASDFRAGRVVPVYPPDGVASNSRTYPPPALDPPGGFRYWSYAGDAGHEHGHPTAASTAVEVSMADGVLVGRADGWRAPVTEFLGEFLTSLCVNLFALRAPSAHAPRVLLDEMVVCRESWRFPASAVPLPRSRPQDFTYRSLRSWADRHGMPRHVFVHAPHEPKPVYVDFAAPSLLDNMARLVRTAATAGSAVTVTEMLPAPDDLWLTDAAGRRYTTELRIVATRTGPDRRRVAVTG